MERELRRLDSKYYEKLMNSLHGATIWAKMSSTRERLLGWDFCMETAEMAIEVLNDIGVHEYALEWDDIGEMKYRVSIDGVWRETWRMY